VARVPLNDYCSWDWASFCGRTQIKALEYCGLALKIAGKRSALWPRDGVKEGVMPKEMVIDQSGFNEDDRRGLRAEVRWSREAEYVQLATVADEAPVAQGLGGEGWHVSLDRRGINELIRYLRRARDQAFGRDE
jgi:hypothetical protein